MVRQVKIVENDAWKFNTSGKLLRNAVPLDSDLAEDVKKDAWETFVKEGASELEREIAACLAPQLSGVDQWDCNSHFMEDLGLRKRGWPEGWRLLIVLLPKSFASESWGPIL